jgi:hypothetical protein
MLLPVLVLLVLVAFDAKFGLGASPARREEPALGDASMPSAKASEGTGEETEDSESLAEHYRPLGYPVFTPKDRDPKA